MSGDESLSVTTRWVRPKPEEVDPDGAPPPMDEAPNLPATAPIIFATKTFAWKDPTTIRPRQFVYGRHLAREYISATLAPGGVGKSSLVLVEAVAMASQRPLLGIHTPKPRRIWYANLEDPEEEIERRIIAICLHHGVRPDELSDRLHYTGRETEIILATQGKTGAMISTPVVDALELALIGGKFDVLTLDPFISVHHVPENDNSTIDLIVKTLGRIAAAANCAIELVHHVRKNGGQEITVEDGRGASALIDASRSARVLNRMTEKEAEAAGVGDKRRFYFRTDNGKATLSPPGSNAMWFELVNVDLGNAHGDDDQDHVGVVSAWTWPDVFAGVTVQHLDKVKAKVREGRWRENAQSKNWVGLAVAEVLGLDASNPAHKAKIRAMLKQWIVNKALVIVEGEDGARRKKSFVEAGGDE